MKAKKLVAGLLIIGSLLASTLVARAETKSLEFTDLVENAWYLDAVKYVVDNGLMNGYTGAEDAGKFGPEDSITRGQIVTILYRKEGEPDVSNIDMTFGDVGPYYYYNAIKWAAKNNIVTGHTAGENAGKFMPDDFITREQLAVILQRYAKYEGLSVEGSSSLAGFKDYEDVSPWAQEGLEFAVSKGIITGDKATNPPSIDPLGNATRAQAATMIMRFCENTKTIEGIFTGDGDFFTDVGGLIFNSDGTVEFASNYSDYGTYTLSGKELTVCFTEGEDGDWNRIKLDEPIIRKLIVKDENTLLYESEDGTMYEYLRERNANIEDIYGIWKNYDEPSEEGFIKFNQDGTYQYLLKKFNSDEMVSDSGTYILIENEVHLKSNSGQDDSLWFSKGKYLVFNSFMKALKRITVESMEGTFWRKL